MIFNRVLGERLLGGGCQAGMIPGCSKDWFTAIGTGSTRIYKNKIGLISPLM